MFSAIFQQVWAVVSDLFVNQIVELVSSLFGGLLG